MIYFSISYSYVSINYVHFVNQKDIDLQVLVRTCKILFPKQVSNQIGTICRTINLDLSTYPGNGVNFPLFLIMRFRVSMFIIIYRGW